MEISIEWGAPRICARAYFVFGILIYNSVLKPQHTIMKSSARATRTATNFIVKTAFTATI